MSNCNMVKVFSKQPSSFLLHWHTLPTSYDWCKPTKIEITVCVFLKQYFFFKLTTCFENTKQGISAMLKKRFPTMSAAWVLAILRQDLNLSSQEQCMTVWILWLVRPHSVAPGSILIGHPRSCWRQHRSAPA